MSALDAWAAGFLGGEGHFSCRPRGTSYQVQIVAVQVASAEPLERLRDLYGGAICVVNDPRTSRKQKWQYGLYGAPPVRAALERMLPHLTVKRREAELLLAIAELIPAKGAPRVGPEQIEERHGLHRSLMAQRRGVAA